VTVDSEETADIWTAIVAGAVLTDREQWRGVGENVREWPHDRRRRSANQLIEVVFRVHFSREQGTPNTQNVIHRRHMTSLAGQ